MSSEPSTDEHTGWQLAVFVGWFTPLQIGLVALRFYARSLTAAKYDLGDILIVVALVCQIIGTGVDIGALVHGGVGYHVEYLEETNPEVITIFFKYLVAISVWYFATITITKLAICKLYRTLFPGRYVFIILCIMAFILIATPVTTVIVLLAACRPFSANWDSAEVQATHCLNKEALFVWGTIPNIFTDVLLLSIPIPIIWKLHATARLKIALFVTFAIGSVGLLASILRFRSFLNTNSFIDATFHAVELIIWTIAEPGIYLISACLLMFRPLLEKVNLRFLASLKSYITSNLSKATNSRVADTSNVAHRMDHGGEMGIALTIRGPNDGFHRLDDNESDPPEQQITVTTNIQQSWGNS